MARQRLNQIQLAALMRCTPGYLQRRLSGVVPWSTDDLDEVASALGAEPRRFIASHVAIPA